MWLVPTKKELKKELDKIRLGFIERDSKIEALSNKVEANSLKIATLEGAYNILSQKSSVSVSNRVNKSHNSIETKLLQRIKHNKKSLVIAEILKLLPNHTTLETYQKIVQEKGLCSKASFYRYIASLNSQRLLEDNPIITKTKDQG